MGAPKPLTRDQLAKFLPDQEAIRRFEQLFQIAGTETPDQIVILFRLAQEIAIDAANAQAVANQALSTLELVIEEMALVMGVPLDQQPADDLAPPVQIGTIASQNAESVEVGTLAATGNVAAASYSVNGNAGASGTGTTITAITVENGIVTAITVT